MNGKTLKLHANIELTGPHADCWAPIENFRAIDVAARTGTLKDGSVVRVAHSREARDVARYLKAAVAV